MCRLLHAARAFAIVVAEVSLTRINKKLESTDLDLGEVLDGEAHTDASGRAPVVRVVAGEDVMRFCVAQTGARVLIGRDPDTCALVLTDSSVSREHCAIRFVEPDQFVVEDLGSTNGTRVNSEPCRGATSVGVGTEVRVGNVPLRFEMLSLAALARLSDKLARLVAVPQDPLTGLLGRPYLEGVLAQQLRTFTVAEMDYSMVVVDVDGLAGVEEQLGKPISDSVLRVLGRLLEESIRDGDKAIRSGRRQFVMVLPNCDEERAARVAEQVRQRVEKHVWVKLLHPVGKPAPGAPTSVGLSCGAAQYIHEEPFVSWLKRASRAAFVARQLGGGRVLLASQVA